VTVLVAMIPARINVALTAQDAADIRECMSQANFNHADASLDMDSWFALYRSLKDLELPEARRTK
jgi:hypothetical protein